MNIATVTSKGQVTLPSNIRKRLGIKTGEKVYFRLDEDKGTALLVPLNKKVNDVFGILKRPGRRKAVTLEQMEEAIGSKFRRDYK